MITNGFSETSGSVGYFAPKRGEYKTPLDKINEQIKHQRQLKRQQKIEKEISEIKNKPQECRSLEDKIKLAAYNANEIVTNLPVPEPMYIA